MSQDQSSQQTNPYAAPEIPPIAPLVAAPADWDARQLEAFVGRKAHYYLAKWAPLLRGWGGSAGFNWAAFFLAAFWLGYRKMYKVACIFFGVILLVSIAEELLFVVILGDSETPAALDRIINLVTAAVCGSYGNLWYLSHARRAIAEVSETGVQGDAQLQALALRGGTSLLASLGLLVLFIVVLFLVFMAFEMLLGGLPAL